MEPKYKLFDAVKIINYGHPVRLLKTEHKQRYSQGLAQEKPGNILNETETEYWIDQMPSIIGRFASIAVVSVTPDNKTPIYKLSGISEKVGWYEEQQLEPVSNATPQ